MIITLTNQVPHLVSDEQGIAIAGACARHVVNFCHDRNLEVPHIRYAPFGVPASKGVIVLSFVDMPPSKDEGAEAWHTEENGVPDGVCFAGWILAHGGSVLNQVAEAMGHEVLELLGDPHCYLVVAAPGIVAPNGKEYLGIWREVCDPMQGHPVIYTIAGNDVTMPGYVLQSWEDPQGRAPFSYPAVVQRPLELAGSEAYADYLGADGASESVFGEHVPQHKRDLRLACGRTRRTQLIKTARSRGADTLPGT